MDIAPLAAARFAPAGAVPDVRPYGSGNVHDTFLVSPPAAPPFILQRLNTRVFPDPELVMANLRVCTAHLRRRLEREPLRPARRWEVPRLLATAAGDELWRAPDGSCWRALTFIDRARAVDVLADPALAREMGFALGLFHRLLSDLPPHRLADTLPGFHVTPRYLERFDAVRARRPLPSSPEADYCLRVIAARRGGVALLEDARARGLLPLRVIHGDPKVNNVLLDADTGLAVSLVDLDTVKPGLVHYDLGDGLRSGCNPRGEETRQWGRVRFDPDLCRAFLHGYLPPARDFLTAADYDYLYDAVHLIAFELGLRFFTDYLEGDVYFRAAYPGHNLARALVQFRLVASLEAQEPALRALIRGLQ